jgi:hypothetical protein
VTAEHVVFTYQAAADPATQSPIAADSKALASVRAVNADPPESSDRCRPQQ